MKTSVIPLIKSPRAIVHCGTNFSEITSRVVYGNCKLQVFYVDLCETFVDF